MWFTYLLLCDDKTIYCGITNDVPKRLLAHKNKKGAKYTQVHGADKIVFKKAHRTKSNALKFEYKIKQISREEKLKLILAYKSH
jgi:putative endonuclease